MNVPPLVSGWLVLPIIVALALYWVWDGTDEDSDDSVKSFLVVLGLMLLARYLP